MSVTKWCITATWSIAWRERGAIFIEQISEVPDGAILIFSAHGVSQAVRNEAKSRDLTVFDATCPLVTKVHMEVARASRRGEESILIGHAGHPEVEGTMGQYSNPEGGMYLVESPDDVWKLTVKNEEKLSFMTQTTLSVDDTSDVIDALRKRFPKIVGPRKDDICYATTNRQEAVRALAEHGSSTGGWFEKLFQLQPSGGTGPAYGQTRVFD